MAGEVGLAAGAVAGSALIAGSVTGTALLGAPATLVKATGAPAVAGNAVIGMGSAGLIGGTMSHARLYTKVFVSQDTGSCFSSFSWIEAVCPYATVILWHIATGEDRPNCHTLTVPSHNGGVSSAFSARRETACRAKARSMGGAGRAANTTAAA